MDLKIEDVQVITGILGAALCLGGWALVWLGTRLIGAGVGMGFGFGFALLAVLAINPEPGTAQAVVVAGLVAGALAGLLLTKYLTTFVFGMVGVLLGLLAGRLGVAAAGGGLEQPLEMTAQTAGILAGAAVAGGVAAVILRKHIVIAITSGAGAYLVVTSVAFFSRTPLLWLLGIFLASVVWQAILVTRLLPGPGRRAG